MKNLLNLAAIILVVIWAVAFLGYGASTVIHLLLLIAVVALVIRMAVDWDGRK